MVSHINSGCSTGIKMSLLSLLFLSFFSTTSIVSSYINSSLGTTRKQQQVGIKSNQCGRNWIQPNCCRHRNPLALFASSSSENIESKRAELEVIFQNQESKEKSIEEMEDMRKKESNFESLFQDQIIPILKKEEKRQPRKQEEAPIFIKEEFKVPILTETLLRRKEIEIELLESLFHTDDSIDKLMAIWMMERNTESAKQLQKMESLCSPGLKREEQILHNMINIHGIHWVEPISRLAAVYYFQGKTADSIYWCNVALSIKPWHFEVAHTLVLNRLRQNDIAQAIADNRKYVLPPLSQPKRRYKWLSKQIYNAHRAIHKAEEKKQQRLNDNSFINTRTIYDGAGAGDEFAEEAFQ